LLKLNKFKFSTVVGRCRRGRVVQISAEPVLVAVEKSVERFVEYERRVEKKIRITNLLINIIYIPFLYLSLVSKKKTKEPLLGIKNSLLVVPNTILDDEYG